MEKELKSYMGVILRADLAGYGHPTLFGRKGLDGHALLHRPALIKTPMQDFDSFSIMFYYINSTIYQKIGDLCCPVHILWTFAQCDLRISLFLYIHKLCVILTALDYRPQ